MNADVIPLYDVEDPTFCPHEELGVLEDSYGALSFECERCGETWSRDG